MKLSRREISVLCGVVDLYIRTGEPVASRQVARSSGFGLSSATIRNVMSELLDRGFLTRSHASAGCVPTTRSYRLYVDSLGDGRRLSPASRARLTDRIQTLRRELVEDLSWVARVAADLTQEAGMAVRPMGKGHILEAVSLVPLSGRRVLGVVVTADGAVEKRSLALGQTPEFEDLQRMSNHINQAFRGLSLDRIRGELEDADDDETPPLARRARDAARRLFADREEDFELQVAGTDNLLRSTEFAELTRMRSLLSTLEDSGGIAREWRRALLPGGAQVILGEESKITESGNLGMVATLYYRHGERAGAVGVVGPRRMNYERIVPVVEFIGSSLTSMLEESGAAYA